MSRTVFHFIKGLFAACLLPGLVSCATTEAIPDPQSRIEVERSAICQQFSLWLHYRIPPSNGRYAALCHSLATAIGIKPTSTSPPKASPTFMAFIPNLMERV